jgi:thiamine biosynthesis protein ThiS
VIALTVNGEAREVDDGMTLDQLVRELGLPVDGIATAVDREVVPRSTYAQTVLTDGMVIEIIRAVGGG